MNYFLKATYNNRKSIEFMIKPTYSLLIKENVDGESFVPRFTLKNAEIFPEYPTNTPMKFTPELIVKAINYGMILQIDYKGAEDGNMSGHERTIYPVAFGKNKEGKYIMRGYHLNGWSVSNGGTLDKEWRLFRCDRILNVVFTGSFFRLAPEGYNESGDKSIADIITIADFNQIRANQQELINKSKIDTRDRIVLNKVNTLEVKDLNYNFKLFEPWANNMIPKKDAKSIRITFAKPTIGTGPSIAIIGTSIEPNTVFKLKSDTTNGSYKSIKWLFADELNTVNVINGLAEYKLYMFIKSN